MLEFLSFRILNNLIKPVFTGGLNPYTLSLGTEPLLIFTQVFEAPIPTFW